jgi:CO/xanthine dehydrogenase Mo-binding subunit
MTIPASLAANPRLDRWVGFEQPGLVRVAIGKVEYGQGALTGLAQIAAEELDVGMARVHLVNPETDLSPDEGLTVGSMSTESSGASIRAACAEVRALFTAAAARRLDCPPAALDIDDGSFLADGEPTGLDYWALAAEVDLAVAPTGEATPKPPERHRIVGKDHARLDLPAKLFGAAYLHDLAQPGMLHARVLRQPGFKARLAGLDEAAIRHAAGAPIEILREAQFVAFLGESEAAVVAAVNAAEQTARWDEARDLAPALSETASLKELPCQSFPSSEPPPEPSNRRRHTAGYSRPYIAHGSMGPSCGLAVFEDGELTVWTHAQGVYPLRALLARVCGLEPAKIKVIHTQGAGTYGHNGSDDAAIDAAVIAVRRPGKPIRVLWRREDEFGHEPLGTAMHIELTAELDAGGRIADYGTEIWSGSHTGGRGRCLAETALGLPPAPPPTPPPGPAGFRFSGGILNAIPSYEIAVKRVTEHVVQAPVRTSSLRGLGGPVNTYANECFVDELAELAGQDPVAFRLAQVSDPRARVVIEKTAAMSGWADRGEAGTGRGLGFAYCRYRDRGAYVAAAVALSVDTEVRLDHIWCVTDCGQVINPDACKNQLEGGMIMAASWALKEQVRLAGRGIVSTTWDDYPILRFDEIPPVDVELIMDQQHQRSSGTGEVSLGPALAAIGNAVAHALGARLRDLPFTRDRIARALLAG